MLCLWFDVSRSIPRAIQFLAIAANDIRSCLAREIGARLCVGAGDGAADLYRAGIFQGEGDCRVLRDLGVVVYEPSPVSRVREGKLIELELEGGPITADAIVLATNAYTPKLGYFKRGILALHSHHVGVGHH